MRHSHFLNVGFRVKWGSFQCAWFVPTTTMLSVAFAECLCVLLSSLNVCPCVCVPSTITRVGGGGESLLDYIDILQFKKVRALQVYSIWILMSVSACLSPKNTHFILRITSKTYYCIQEILFFFFLKKQTNKRSPFHIRSYRLSRRRKKKQNAQRDILKPKQ